MDKVHRQHGSIVLYEEKKDGEQYIRIAYADNPVIAPKLSHEPGISLDGNGNAYIKASDFRLPIFHDRYSPHTYIDYSRLYAGLPKSKREYTFPKLHPDEDTITDRIERLKKLVEKREEYVNTIFTEVKNKLVEFVNGKDYKDYLLTHVKAVSDEYQMTDCVLYVRKDDLKYADDLKKAYALPIEVEEGQQIQLGGFIIENKATNVVVDESLDSNLEAQKDWFYKTSGLMIK